MLRYILSLLAMCILLTGWSSAAHAQSSGGRLAISLEGLAESLPTTVCVVYEPPTGRPKPDSADMNALRFGSRSDARDEAGRLEWASARQRAEGLEDAGLEQAARFTKQLEHWRESLREQAAETLCVLSKGVCRRDTRWPSKKPGLRVRCAGDPRIGDAGGASARTLVLQLDTVSAVAPDVFAVALQGNQVSLVLSSALPDRAALVSVLGADYTPGTSSHNHGDLVVLEVAPRCIDRDVPAPGSEWRNDDRHIEITYIDRPAESQARARTCILPIDRPLRVRLPRASDRVGTYKELALSIVDGKVDGVSHQDDASQLLDSKVAYRGRHRWVGAQVPDAVLLTTERIRFRWRADTCLFRLAAQTDCPSVTTSAGAVCQVVEVSGTNECVYSCADHRELGSASSLELTFSVGKQNDAWRSVLAGPDQVLTGYADRDSRQVLVDFELWQDSPWPPLGDDDDDDEPDEAVGLLGDRIKYVEIVNPAGGVSRVVPAPGQRVSIRGASCGDILEYRVVGSRRHDVGYVAVRNGGLTLPAPEATMKKYGLSLYAAGGANFDSDSLTFAPTGTVGAALRREPTWGWRPSALGFELQGLATFTSFFSRGVPVPGSVASRQEQPTDEDIVRLPYTRLFAAAAVDFAVSEHWRLGAASGIGAGLPLFFRDQETLGGPVPLWMGALYGRYVLGHHFALEAAFRAIAPQRSYDYLNDVRSPARREDRDLLMLSFEGGLRYAP